MEYHRRSHPQPAAVNGRLRRERSERCPPMELKKMSCSQCGAALEILPGIERVKCKACGTVYAITGTVPAPHSARAGSADLTGDNPVEVHLVRLPVNTISLGMHATGRGVRIFDRDRAEKTADWEKLDAAIGKKLAFLACAAWAAGEEYTVDIGDFAFNETHLYYTGDGLLESGGVPQADRAGLLKEPDKAYHHPNPYNNPGALAKPRYAGAYNTCYDREENARRNQDTLSRMNALIRKYHIAFTDEVRYSSVYREKYQKTGLFGRKTDKARCWVVKYTSRRMTIPFSRQLAGQTLTHEDMEKIDRMGMHPCIAEMAGAICSELRRSAREQLEQRKLKTFRYNVLYDMLNLPSAEASRPPREIRYTNRSGAFILYSHYGMGEIKNTKLQFYLAANLKKEINKNLAATDDPGWHIVNWVVSEDTGPYEPYVEVELMPAARTVGVYQSWV